MKSAAPNFGKTLIPFIKWFFLTFGSGWVNTAGFLAAQRFVSHVTGFFTLVGISVEQTKWIDAASFATVPVYFLVGCVYSSALVDRRIQLGKNPWYAVPLLSIAFVLSAAAFLGWYGYFGKSPGEDPLSTQYPLLVLLSFASGIQNALVTHASGTIIRSSHLTGTITDLGIGLARASFQPLYSVERRLEGRLNLMRFATIIAFVTGAIAGAYSYPRWEYLSFLGPAGIAFGVAIWIGIRHR